MMNLRWMVMLFCCLAAESLAQDFTQHNWYFGNSNTAIRFSRSDNTASLVTNQKTPFGTGGSAVVTNPYNADLVFYTDGSRVYDITGTLTTMPNGFGLSGNTSGNQPVAICPIPDEPNQFYIFTNSANGTTAGSVLVSTVDMTQFGNAIFPAPASGDVTAKNQAFGIAANSRSEAMLIIPHADGETYWLLTHENGTDNYTVTHIQPGGNFVHTTFAGLTGGFNLTASNFAYHEATGKIAVSPLTVNRNVVILDFVNTAGTLAFDQFVFNSASTTAGALYDTEWSPSGRFLYISRLNDSGADAQVLRYDTSNPGSSLSPMLTAAVNRSYGLQLAPDTAIYHIYQQTGGGPFLIGKLTQTDSVASLVVHTPIAFTANPNISGTQFPSFAPAPEFDLDITFISAGNCANVATSFYPTVIPTADSLLWDLGDGSFSSEWSPVHTYTNGGTINVTVTAFLNGQSESFSSNINITQFDLTINLVADTTACECELPINNGIPPCPNDTSDDIRITAEISGGTPTSIIWSNGDTGPTLTPDSAGYYYVVVTDASGCSTYAGVNVREYGLQDQRANIWHFGQNAGIDFNQIPSVPISGPINSPEGVAVISNRNGNVIFSTDGQRVFDRNNVDVTPAPVPPGLGGEPGATQAALIIPVPGDETLYYIFTTQEVHGTGMYELRYSLFDVKLNNGDGGIAQHNQLLFTRSTERITGNNGWLIAHEFGNNSFRAYPITSNGIGNPVITSIGSDHSLNNEISARGYMKLGFNNVLAVALSIPGVSNVLELFDFDNATGVLSNYRVADLNSATGQVYGVEFAGNKIFATLTGSPSLLREFYIDYEGNPVLITPNAAPVAAELGAIQLGPDGQLYVAVNNQSFLGTIQVNADTLLTSTFILNGYALAGGTQSTLGLPNFIQNVGVAPQEPGMLISGFCLGEPTAFTGIGTDSIDEFQWSFGDGFGSDSAVVQHTYAAAGDYIVTLRVFNRCGLDTTMTQTITIFPPPANPTFLAPGDQPVICDGLLTLEATPATNPDLPNLSFLWSTTETERTIEVSQPAIISVVITNNVSGCTSEGSILVADNRPPVNLGPDLTYCQNEPVAPLDASNPNAQHVWTINGGAGSTTRFQSVASSVPGIFEYIVQVTDPITSCVVRDTVVLTFSESPLFTAVANPTSACLVNDGSIDLEIISPATSLFSYTVTGPSTADGIDRAAGVVVDPNLTALASGTYAVVVIDQVSNCATIDLVSVNDNAFMINSIVRQNTCDPLILEVDHDSALPFTFRVIDDNTAQVVTTGNGNGTPFTTPGVPSGTYVVEMTAGGCTFAAPPQTFTQDDVVAITGFTTDPCTNPISITVNGGAGWTWGGPGIIGSVNTQTITASAPAQGDNVYTVIVTEAGFCPLDTAVTVFVNNNIAADFDQTDACADQVTLTATATPTATYNYVWFRNGLQIPGGQSILANHPADNGANYQVTVINPATGCQVISPIKQVFVTGDLQLSMTTTPPCTGQPFTITASSTQPGTNFTWALNGTPIAGATQPTLVANSAGLYRLTGTLPGCSRFIENQIVLFPSTPGSLPDRALICPDPGNPDPNTQQVVLDAGTNFVSYDWYRNGAQQNVFTQTFTAFDAGLYRVVLQNSFGCETIDETQVVEECKPRLVAPNAFRPGSNVVNPGDPDRSNSDFWVLPLFIDPDGFEIFIFNRWGEMVFQSKDSNFRWNGGYNNNVAQLLPAGTYTYVVKYKSVYRPQDGIQEKRGGVLLVR